MLYCFKELYRKIDNWLLLISDRRLLTDIHWISTDLFAVSWYVWQLTTSMKPKTFFDADHHLWHHSFEESVQEPGTTASLKMEVLVFLCDEGAS
jgi:hypothetical protein